MLRPCEGLPLHRLQTFEDPLGGTELSLQQSGRCPRGPFLGVSRYGADADPSRQ